MWIHAVQSNLLWSMQNHTYCGECISLDQMLLGNQKLWFEHAFRHSSKIIAFIERLLCNCILFGETIKVAMMSPRYWFDCLWLGWDEQWAWLTNQFISFSTSSSFWSLVAHISPCIERVGVWLPVVLCACHRDEPLSETYPSDSITIQIPNTQTPHQFNPHVFIYTTHIKLSMGFYFEIYIPYLLCNLAT